MILLVSMHTSAYIKSPHIENNPQLMWGCVFVTQSWLTLCDPVDYNPPGSSVHGILQVRILEWVAIFSSRGSSRPKDQSLLCCTVGRFFTREAPGKPSCYPFCQVPLGCLFSAIHTGVLADIVPATLVFCLPEYSIYSALSTYCFLCLENTSPRSKNDWLLLSRNIISSERFSLISQMYRWTDWCSIVFSLFKWIFVIHLEFPWWFT